MSLRITCRAGDLSAYVKYLVSTNGKDCLVTDLNTIVSRKKVKKNV